jgi:hypothetical protein
MQQCRDEYAGRLRERLAHGGRSAGPTLMLTAAQAAVTARLLDELAGVYRGESLGLLARELSALLDSRFGDRGASASIQSRRFTVRSSATSFCDLRPQPRPG